MMYFGRLFLSAMLIFFPLLRNPRISYRHHYNKTKLLMGYVLLGKCAIWWQQNWQKYIHTVDVILYLTGPTKSFYIVHGHYIGYNMDISSQNFRLIRQKFAKMQDRPLSTHTYIHVHTWWALQTSLLYHGISREPTLFSILNLMYSLRQYICVEVQH